MDISEAFDIIEAATTEYFEARLFNIYVTSVDKEKYPNYEEYKNLMIKPQEANNIVDVEERKKEAENILKSLMKGG